MWARAVMKNRLLSQVFEYIVVCQFERWDPYSSQRSGKIPMSIGITILKGSNAPMMTGQVNIC